MDDLKWITTAIIGIVTMIGGLIARDRQIHSRIETGDSDIMKKVEEIKKDYVRRDDLKDHLQSIERIIGQSRDEQRELARRIDHLLSTITHNAK